MSHSPTGTYAYQGGLFNFPEEILNLLRQGIVKVVGDDKFSLGTTELEKLAAAPLFNRTSLATGLSPPWR